MKKKFTILITAAFMLLTMMARPMTVWGQTKGSINWVASQQGYTNQQEITSVTFDSYVSATFNKGTNNNAPKYYTTGAAIRCYGGNYFTVTTSSGNLTEITLSFASGEGSNAITTNVGTYKDGTWTGEASSVTFTIGGTSGHRRIASFAIEYTTGVSDPSITASNVDIAYNATGGEIEYTVSNPVTGGTMSSAIITGNEWLTAGTPASGIVSLSCAANTAAAARTATVRLTYTFNTNQTVTKDVTVTQAGNPDAFITIAEARAQGSGNVVTKGYVTSCVGTTGYIQDATAAICVYGSALTIGDEIRVAGTLSDYNGLLEITNPTVTVVSSGNTIDPELMTIAEAVASTNQGWFIRIENATVTNITGSGNSQNTTIAQGENTIVIRGNLNTTVAVNDHISFNGNIGYYNANQIANPQSVSVLQNDDPTISAENVNIASNATEGVIEYTINNPVSGGSLTASSSDEWLTIGTVGATVPFTCTANTAVTARTATVTLTYTYNSNETVNKNVTVTQAAYEAPHYTWDLSTSSYDPNPTENLVTWSSTYATMTNAKGTSSNAANNYLGGDANNRTSTRFYANQILTISPAVGYAITSVVFTATTESYATAFEGSTWTNASVEASGTTITVTPTNGNDAVQAKIGGTCGFTAVSVYYVEDNTPSITANNIEIAFDATQGEIAYTLYNPIIGGSLIVSEEVDWISNAVLSTTESKVTFDCEANTNYTSREGVVTITYNYGDNQSVSKNVTVTQAAAPLIYSTIPDLFAAATSTAADVTVSFNNWVVSGVSTNGKNVFVTDGTNGFVIYGTDLNNTYSVGNILQGTIDCSLKLQNGYAQLSNVDGLTIVDGGSVVVAQINMADLAGINTGALVSYENLTCSVNNNKYYLTDGTTTLQVYNSLFAFEALEDGKTYNITGIYQQYSDTKEILPRSAADIVEVTIVIPSISITPDELSLDAEMHIETLPIVYENLEITDYQSFHIQCYNANGEEIEMPTTWFVAGVTVDLNNPDNYVVDCELSENKGEARSAYFKVYALDGDANNVYSNLVTVNQAAPVVPPTPGNWVLTDLADLTDSDIFVIVGNDGDNYAMSNNNGTSSAPSAVEVTVSGNTLSGDIADNIQWNISGNATDGYIFYPNGDTESWLYCNTGSTNNRVRVGTGDNKLFVLASDYLKCGNYYIGVYSSQDWRGYSSINANIEGQTFAFYKKVTGPIVAKPTFNPEGGEYTSVQTVTINCSTENATIYYKVDENADWTEYTDAIAVNVTTTIWAYATKAEMEDSPVATATYTINLPVPTITVEPALVEATTAVTEGSLAMTLDNIVITAAGGGMFDVIFCDSEGTALVDQSIPAAWFGFDFTYENSAWLLDYLVLENTSTTPRSTYFKVYGVGDDGTTEAYSNIVYVTQEGVTPKYLVSFNLDGGTFVPNSDFADDIVEKEAGVYELPSATKDNTNFVGWLLDGTENIYAAGESYEVTADVSFTAQWSNALTGTITFGSASGSTAINTTSVSGNDNLGNTWTITSVFGDAGSSFTQNAAYSQVGASSKPATSITFTMTLPYDANITAFSAKFGGFNSTAGDITLKVGETIVGTGSLNATTDVTVESTSSVYGKELTITVTNIAKGVKAYYISYSYTMSTDPIINAPASIDLASDATSGEIEYSIINPATGVSLEATSTDSWISNFIITDEKVSFTTTANTEMTERQGTITLSYTGAESKDVTVIQAAYVPPVVVENYALFIGDLVEGDYIIYYDGKAMKNTVSSNRLQYTEITPEDNIIATDNADIIWHIAPSGEYWTIYNVATNAYAASTGIKNQAAMMSDGTDDKALWTVSGTEAFEFVNKNNSDNDINANLRNNGTYGFACYAASTGGALTLYKKVTTIVAHNKTITGYNDSQEGGYYLIASPVYSLDPANVTGMAEGTFDLYRFDQSLNNEEWRNYKAGAFYLTPGKGYLYAKNTDVTLNFEGMPYEGDGKIALDYTDGANFAGWNLIGNPFSTAASISQPYYRLNTDGSALNVETESSEINVMEGVFVQATAADQTATFTAQTRNAEHRSIAQANIMISQNGSIIDKAIVRFDNGSTLGKFQLNENSSKVYFTKNNQDYAIVCGDVQGEMPVNFKASENGTFTLSFTAQNVEFSYLHLIDNKTGMDIDLMQTSNYTFEASKVDYASRFKLVFSANNNEMVNDYGFFDANGNLNILGIEGLATLQVIDVTGRVISNETISGNYSKAINAKAGVYMLRLIQGNDVRTQKIVVR